NSFPGLFRPGLFAFSQSYSQYSITDRATTVPSADVTDDQGIIAGYNDRGIRVTPLRKTPAYFRRPPRIFPQKIRPTRAHSGNKAMKMRLSWWEVVGTGIASTCRLYYQRLYAPVISVALPLVGMILFAAILLGLSGAPRRAPDQPLSKALSTRQ